MPTSPSLPQGNTMKSLLAFAVLATLSFTTLPGCVIILNGEPHHEKKHHKHEECEECEKGEKCEKCEKCEKGDKDEADEKEEKCEDCEKDAK